MDLEDRLRQTASSFPEVKLVVLFGSTARGQARPGSDIDLGVLLDPYSPELRFRVEAALGRTAGRTVDVVLLDDAPPLLRFEIARDGVLLFEREDYLWTDFKVRAMVDGEFLTDVKSRDLATFYLFLAIQECIDLAAHWVADAGWTVPDEAGSTFELLADQRALDHDLAAALRGAVGLRNRIAHGYASVNHERVHQEYRGRRGGGVAPLPAPGEHRGGMSRGGNRPALD